jgi:hypothetical protein
MNLKLGNKWQKSLRGKIEGYEFEVGVLEDSDHFYPKDDGVAGQRDLSSYAGGPVRKKSRKAGPESIGQVFIDNQERINTDLLKTPLEDKSSDIVAFTTAFLKLVTGRAGMNIRRVENLLQAVVRNPILRGDYGTNKAATADAKGFNRHLIDTGQMFKAIVAKARRV